MYAYTAVFFLQELSVGYVDWVVSQKAQGKLCARDVADKFPVTW